MAAPLSPTSGKPKAFTFVPHGAILQTFTVSNQNLVLNFTDPAEYVHNPCYFGATIGRVANRIADASFTLNGGTKYQLAANNGPCALHGGVVGWDRKAWTHERSEEVDIAGVEVEGGSGWRDVFSLVSEDGDEGYPGTVRCELAYTQYRERWEAAEGGWREVLEMEFAAGLVDVKGVEEGMQVQETVLNLTNHSYFNLSPSPSQTIAGTIVTLPTTTYLPVDPHGIPLTASTSTPYPSLTPHTPFTLGPVAPDIDDCFLLNPHPSTIPLDTRPLPMTTCVAAHHPATRLHLEVATTEPAFQLYTGKYISVDARADGTPERVARGGFCVEPSRYVDAVNREEWRGMVVVGRGEVYGSRIVYRGWKAAAAEVEVAEVVGVEPVVVEAVPVEVEALSPGKAEKAEEVVEVLPAAGKKASKKERRMSMKAVKAKGGKCVVS